MSALLIMVAAPVVIGVAIAVVYRVVAALVGGGREAPSRPQRSRSMATEVRKREKVNQEDMYEDNPDDSLLTLSDDELAEMCPF